MRLLVVKEAKKRVVKGNPCFSDLKEDVLAGVFTGMHLNSFEREERDDCAGLHIIQHGSVKLFKISPQGRELVIKVLKEGATFNEVPVIDNQLNPVNAAAIEVFKI